MTDELMKEIEAEYLYKVRRSFETQDCGIAANLLDRIKTELSEKAARIAALEAALRPFADKAKVFHDYVDDYPIMFGAEPALRVGDLRAASAAYLGEKE